jgi:hypothetical protein
VHLEPAALYRELEASDVFRGHGVYFEQHRPVEEFDMDAVVLHGFDGIGDLDQLARGGFGSE